MADIDSLDNLPEESTPPGPTDGTAAQPVTTPDCTTAQLALPLGLMALLLIVLFVICPRIRAYRLSQTYLGPSTSIIDLDLSSRDLSGKDLSNITMWHVNLTGTNLQRANLSGAWLDALSMKGANLQGANLRGAWLTGADLANAELAGADLTGVHYDNLTHWPAGFNLQPWKAKMIYYPPGS